MYLSGILSLIAVSLQQETFPPTVTLLIGVVLLIPGGVDGTTQMFYERESTNLLRAITGAGMGTSIIFISYGGILAIII